MLAPVAWVVAAALSQEIAAASVVAPSGATVAVASVLDESRLSTCLATVEKAQGWPASWLVVQDLGLDWDLVLRVEKGEDGVVHAPGPFFAAPRVAWDDGAFDAAYRRALGRKPPRERNRSLVVQAFKKRTETEFVWDLPPTGKEAKGLLALLPEGSWLRESKSVRWSDGRRLTIALVLERPRFVPSACGDEGIRDHADNGRVMLYLAGETALEGSLDLTDRFREEPGGEPLVPHWECREGDDDPALREISPAKRFAEVPPIGLLQTFRPADGSDEVDVRVVGVDRGRGRRDRAVVRIVEAEEGKGFDLRLE